METAPIASTPQPVKPAAQDPVRVWFDADTTAKKIEAVKQFPELKSMFAGAAELKPN